MTRIHPTISATCIVSFALAILLSQCTNAQDLASAHELYSLHLLDASEGVYQKEGMIFVVVTISDASKVSKSRLQAKCLVETNNLLRQFISDEESQTTNSILEALPFLLETCREQDPRFATSNFNFKNLKVRILANRLIGDDFRYVTACMESDFRDQVVIEGSSTVSIDATRQCLRSQLDSFRDENPQKSISLLLRCGAVEPALNVANDESSIDFTFSSVGSPKIDSLAMYQRWPDAIGMLKSEKCEVAQVRHLLRDWPGFPPAFRWVHRHYKDQGKHTASLNALFMARVIASSDSIDSEFADQVRSWHQDVNQPCLIEYAKLVTNLETKEFRSRIEKEASSMPPVVSRALNTLGHFNFPSGHVPSNPEETGVNAAQISSSTSIGEATQLFSKAIAVHSTDSQIWSAIGASHIEHNQHLFAILFLNQAMRLEPANTQTKLRLCECYENLNFDRLAVGMAISAILTPKPSEEQIADAVARIAASCEKRQAPSLMETQ